jgi:hypothetical protein
MATGKVLAAHFQLEPETVRDTGHKGFAGRTVVVCHAPDGRIRGDRCFQGQVQPWSSG